MSRIKKKWVASIRNRLSMEPGSGKTQFSLSVVVFEGFLAILHGMPCGRRRNQRVNRRSQPLPVLRRKPQRQVVDERQPRP